MTRRSPALPQTPAREKAARPPALPPSLAALADARWRRDLVGEAGAAVYRVQRRGQPDLYLKQARGEAAQALVDELARLQWLADFMPTAPLRHFEFYGRKAWLLTQAVPGRTAYEWLQQAPERTLQIVAALVDALLRLHALPAAQCPFQSTLEGRLAQAHARLEAGLIDVDDFDDVRAGWTANDVWRALQRLSPEAIDPVVTHGDYSLDNILLDERLQLTGLIDVGRLGVADRYQDLAILWNCLGEFGPQAQQALFPAYGIPKPDRRRLDFYLCLDECF
ncbi:APH(3') family aminoglycoside O-phosphotransferase [Pelomonas cellulosilytica]|uniref:Aminoglycoside 3'-phosphotransferase n=1 Tax=Pelomonas cellulosilytica TaxID=2906762 RepID=A0ABS8XSC6_9BURK|nr:APH(3') family aminoglycoside O-phosphotransferase [Pelomonas sp. P8]MCE4553589.1 aminoglycoside 3'-phosphotransferase [Pelomonas sp. P8]